MKLLHALDQQRWLWLSLLLSLIFNLTKGWVPQPISTLIIESAVILSAYAVYIAFKRLKYNA